MKKNEPPKIKEVNFLRHEQINSLKGQTVYIVRDEVSGKGESIATFDPEVAKKYAKAIISNYRKERLKSKAFTGNMASIMAEMKSEKMKSSTWKYSWWGRGAEVEITTLI